MPGPLAAIALAATLAASPAGEGLGPSVDAFCTGCHGALSRKAGLDLRPLVTSPGDAPLRTLRLARDHLRRGDMPPEGEEAPAAAERQAMIDAIGAELRRREPGVTAGRPTLRRLNRVEFRNSVRELLGVDVDTASELPPDDVGEGFDHIGDVLSMPPILLEKYLDVAERAALKAWPDEGEPFVLDAKGTQLKLRGGGRVEANGAHVWSAGAAYVDCELPREGTYRVTFSAFGDQAGDQPVQVAVRDARVRLATFDIPERRGAPGTRSAVVPLRGGQQSVGVEFLNDFYDESRPEGQRDRNVQILSIRIEGPVDSGGPTQAAAALAGSERTTTSFVRGLLRRAFRRPPSDAEVAAFAQRADKAAGADATWPQRARAALTMALVDPRFLFHVEADASPGAGDRDLDGHELAARLASFLWRSLPDAALDAAAERGDLASPEGLRREADRLVDDPRSLAFAEEFAQQWLFIRSVPDRQLDPALFPGVDAALLADMRAETTLFVDTLLREDRPLSELFDADWTFLDARLARHYGIEGVDGDWLRRVRIGDARVRGLLGHASVLVATSNPTRTSPVKRGKWVLEAMLDAAPPPPPPGVPLLPDVAHDAGRDALRTMMERHRADPACAGCHRQMDAIGLALEPLDAVGRWRTRDGDHEIDATGDLPDGRRFDGPRELSAILAKDPAVARSIARHLLVYALGRALREEDQLAVDRIVREAGERPTFRSIIRGIVAGDQFRRRSPPESDSQDDAGPSTGVAMEKAP